MYFHGTSSSLFADHNPRILPPEATGLLQEQGRRRNLDKVFFTTNYKYALTYAHKSVNKFGGKPLVLRFIPMSVIEVHNEEPGCTTYSCSWGFAERIDWNNECISVVEGGTEVATT